jgi:hypothetical protein
MSIIADKMYSYDFVYGNCSLDHLKSEYQVEKVENGSERLLSWVENK